MKSQLVAHTIAKNVGPKIAALTILGVSAALFTGCGGSTTSSDAPPHQDAGPAAKPASAPAHPGTECGALNAMGSNKVKVVIREGSVDCAQATDLLTQYFQQLTPTELAKPDGPGPIAVGRWTCGGAAANLASTCSTEDGRQVDGVPA